jgi:tRNA G10  N-methylase Trm11
MKMIDKRDSLSNLVSPMSDTQRSIYNWHSFKHSYSKALVDTLVNEFKLKKGSWVLDPFCGGGTTLLACKELGINSRGFDILPFSVFLTNVKTNSYIPEQLAETRSTFRRIKRVSKQYPSLTNIPIAQKAFSASIRDELIRIKQWVEQIADPITRDFFNLGLLSILESVSKTSKSGGFLRLRDNRVRAKTVETRFLSRIDSMISDVQKFNAQFKLKRVCTWASLGDARRLHTARSFDAIITSPPYPNRHDYSRIYSLEMLFDFVESNDDLKSIRYETLRSHVEARNKFECTNYDKPEQLARLIKRVKNNGTNNPLVTDMLEGYFEDMYLALNEMTRRLRENGKIALVVSNVRFAGVNIPVDEILAEIGEQVGLKSKAIWIVRYRGNSSQQMKEYKRRPSRESIVIWSK